MIRKEILYLQLLGRTKSFLIFQLPVEISKAVIHISKIIKPLKNLLKFFYGHQLHN